MRPDTVVFKCKIKIWWYIFFGFQILLLALMIGSIFSKRMFYMMYISEMIYSGIEAFAIVAMVIWIISMFSYSKSVGCFNMSYCGSICSCFCHYLGFFAWYGTSFSQLSRCRGLSSKIIDSDYIKYAACESDGPNLAIAVMVILPIVMAAYFVFVYYAKNGKNQTPNQNEDKNIPSTNPINSQPFLSAGPVVDKHQKKRSKEESKTNPPKIKKNKEKVYSKDPPKNSDVYSEDSPKNSDVYSEDPPENSDVYLIYYDPNNPPDVNDSNLNIELWPLQREEDPSDD